MINHFCKRPLWDVTKTLADVAQGRRPADTVIRGAAGSSMSAPLRSSTVSTSPSQKAASPSSATPAPASVK